MMTHSLFAILLMLLFFCFPFRALAQVSPNLGTYHSVYFEIPVSKKWSVFNEDELRGARFFNKYYYNEVKAGINYKYSKRVTLTMALGVYNTFKGGKEYDDREKKTDYRFWQQLKYKQAFFKGVLDHRVRVEELINKNFRPTIRYRLQPKWPLNKPELTTGAFFGTAYDELYFQFVTPGLRRNRIFGGFGYYFSKKIYSQVGILRQTDYKSEGPDFTRNFFYLSGSFRL